MSRGHQLRICNKRTARRLLPYEQVINGVFILAHGAKSVRFRDHTKTRARVDNRNKKTHPSALELT
jgi:hypothetical protein